MERKSKERHEYLDGEIYSMAGESPRHGDISSNLVAILNLQLRGGPCRVWTKDVKILSGSLPYGSRSREGLFSYPDAVIVCGIPQFLDEHQDVLCNPKVIIEVLSPSTEAFDRGEKFHRYRTHNSSLSDYLVVEQNKPFLEHFTRLENGLWAIKSSILDLRENLYVESIECTLRLAEVYDRVSFISAELEESATNESGS